MVDLSAVRRIIIIQVAVAILMALIVLIFSNLTAAASALAGGAIGFLSSSVYAIRMHVQNGSDARKIMRAHYSAEAFKLTIAVLLFTLVFTQFKELQALPFLGTYVATLTVYWIALIFV
jgi:ATP synthase protein I